MRQITTLSDGRRNGVDTFENIDFSYARFWHSSFTNGVLLTNMAFTKAYNCEFKRCIFTFNEGFMTGGIMVCKLGSYDLALQALAKAVDGGYTVVEPLLHDPWLAPLREDPRFTETLRRAQARRDEALAVFCAEGGEALLGVRSAA